MSSQDYCGGPGSEGSALACFAYPNERFKDKPHFVAATFFVSEIQSAQTEKECQKGSPNWWVINSKAGTTTINHVTFKTFEIGTNWTSHGESGPAYRSFHNGKCYELGIQTVISRAEYDPGTANEFTKKDWSEVERRLRQALNSGKQARRVFVARRQQPASLGRPSRFRVVKLGGWRDALSTSPAMIVGIAEKAVPPAYHPESGQSWKRMPIETAPRPCDHA